MKRILSVIVILISLVGFGQTYELINTLPKPNPAGTPFKWAQVFPIPYFIHRSGTPDIPGTGEFAQLKQGMAKWNPVSPLKFKFAGTTGTVEFGDLVNGIIFDGANFDAGSSVLAYMEAAFFTSNPNVRVEGDLHFNDRDFKWTKAKTNAAIDIYKILPVAVHEMGHSVGLNHSAIFDATMFFQNQGDDRGSTLHPDDIAGAKFLYGPPLNTAAVPILLSPLNNTIHRVLVGTGTQAASGITFRWTQNTTNNLSGFGLEFAGDPNFTLNKKRFNAGVKLALFMAPGAKLNALKIIQTNSPTGRIYWRVTARNASGATVTSVVFSFQLEQVN